MIAILFKSFGESDVRKSFQMISCQRKSFLGRFPPARAANTASQLPRLIVPDKSLDLGIGESLIKEIS
jgi:hypothetical protein